MFKLFLLSTFAVSCCVAEAPYAPAGFRPTIPFDLPNEYYPAEEVYDPNQGYSFEISKQRVDFAGQEIQRVPAIPSEPQNQYLPPNQSGFNNNRDTPNNQRPQGHPFFNHRHNHGRRNNGRPAQRPSTQTPQKRPPQFQPNFPPTNIPLPKPNTDERFETQQFFNTEQQQQQQKPAFEYGAPNYNIDPRYNRQQQQQRQYNFNYQNSNSQQQQQQPALEYGAPNNNFESSNQHHQQQQQQQQQRPALEYGAPADNQSIREEELEKQFALEALNAAVENYNRLQENEIDRIAQGQYFVVNPDHSIQKVKFTTKKSKDESRPTDFTAELNYTKVGEINDPLYKYTAEGQLVRIVKK